MVLKTFSVVLQVVIFGALVGGIVSITSVGFVSGVGYMSSWRDQFGSCLFGFGNICFSIQPLLFLLACALLIILVKRTLNIERYHGPADVILSAHSPSQDLDPKTGFLSTFSAFVSASGGASVGQYGPLVHLGGTIGNLINKKLPHLLTKDTFIGCGVAAAISAGFNSPIGGIIFAHEAILRHFSFRAIAPIAVSSVVSSTLANYFFPSGILFQNTSAEISLLPSVSLSLILGPLCAFVSVLFMLSLLKLQKYSNRINSSELIRILYAAVFVGIVGGFMPEVLGLGGETIVSIIEQSYTLSFLVFILVLKLVVTVTCLSMGFFGGVFSPALVLGAALGGILTYIGSIIGITNLGDSLILAGMAALSASVIGAPIASIVIIFELSHSYDLAFVAIICVAGSCLISSLIFGHSFFDIQLINRNFRISRGRADILLSETSIKNVLGNNQFLSTTKTKKKELLDLFSRCEFTEAYILNEKDQLIGKIRVNDVMRESNEEVVIDRKPLCLNINESVSEAITKASNFVGESIPVVTQTNKLVGVITEADLFLQYLSVQESISNIEKD